MHIGREELEASDLATWTREWQTEVIARQILGALQLWC